MLLRAPGSDTQRAREEAWVKNVRPMEAFWNRLRNNLGKAGLIGREAMNVDLHDELVKTLNQTPANAKDILENMARQKSEFELERLRRAATIADDSVEAQDEAARIGH